MEIKVEVLEVDYGNRAEELFIDGKNVIDVYPLYECSEDAIIGRSLVSCRQIANFMKLAHDVGIKGEPLTIVIEKVED